MPRAKKPPKYTCPTCRQTLPEQPIKPTYPPTCTGNGKHKPEAMKENV